jgi:hypothetical protein
MGVFPNVIHHSRKVDWPHHFATSLRAGHRHAKNTNHLVALVVATSRGPDFNIWPSGRVNGVGSGARVSADPVWISSFVRAEQAISS